MNLFSNKAKLFAPHAFKNTVDYGPIPKILMTPDVIKDMYSLVKLVSQEVGWIGSVQMIGDDYLIDEVFLLEQEVHATTTEITPEGLSKFAMNMIDNRKDGLDIVNRIRFWGHSHVNMATNPSGQDDAQMAVFADDCDDYFIRGILNKKGRMEFSLFQYDRGIIFHDVTWEVHYDPKSKLNKREARWTKEISDKVTEKSYFQFWKKPAIAEEEVEVEEKTVPVKTDVLPHNANGSISLIETFVQKKIKTTEKVKKSDSKKIKAEREAIEKVKNTNSKTKK